MRKLSGCWLILAAAVVLGAAPRSQVAATAGPQLASPQLLAAARPWRITAQLAKLQATRRDPGAPFTFVVMSDSQSLPQVFTKILNLTARLKPDFSMHNGDAVPGGKPDEFAALLSRLRGVTWPFLRGMGNHDTYPRSVGGRDTSGRLFTELFGATNYYFDRGGVRFVVVDTARYAVTPAQRQWLDRVLTTKLRKIVFTHMPPVVIRKWAWHGFESGAAEFADIMARRKVERVYVGHIHGFDVARYRGVTYVLSAGAGAPLRWAPGSSIAAFFHVVRVEVRPTGLVETVFKTDGTNFVLKPEAWIARRGVL